MSEITPLQIVIALVVLILGPGGGLFIGLRGGLNGMRESQRRTEKTMSEIHKDVKSLARSDAKQSERLGIVETKLDSFHGWITRVEKDARGD